MLEQETAHIIGDLFSRTMGERDSLLLRDLVTVDIPRGIKAYLRAEITRSLRDELAAAPTFGGIDRSIPGTQRMIRALVTGVAEAYSFTRNTYRTHLENAVHFLGNYLCRPQWTLEHLVYGEAERVSTATMRERFDYVSDYAYFRTLVEKIIQQRNWTEVRRDDFRQLLALVDDRVVKEHNPRELALLAKPLYDFLLLRDTPPDASIPLKPVLVFFEDKKMRILRDYIEDICRIRDRIEITLDELTALVEDLYLGRPDSTGEDTTPPAVPAEPAEERQEPPKTQLIDAAQENPPAVPLRPARKEPAKPDQGMLELFSPADPGEQPMPSDTPPSDNRNVALALTSSGVAGGQGTGTTRPLRSIISDHHRVRFLRRVFDKDEAGYESALDALDAAPTWRDASQVLSELYQSRSLDPFDADVVAFTDTVHGRYMDRE